MNTRTRELHSYDKVFGEEVSTQEIFDSQIAQLVDGCLRGINQTVFAYGQTSSGKTYTMRGYPSSKDEGLITLTVKSLFRKMEELKSATYRVTVSYLEVSSSDMLTEVDLQRMH